MLAEETALALLQKAQAIATNAYAPYSVFPVGAALLSNSGDVICGVNVENVSYGLTICAERCAVFTAISQGQTRFLAMAVWASARPHGAVTPCGACRQVMAEFMAPEAVVIMRDEATGNLKQLTLKALLPEAFALALDENCPDTSNN